MNDSQRMLHLLRNPWGHSEDDVRRARLWAADRIEQFEREEAARRWRLSRLRIARVPRQARAALCAECNAP